MNNPNTTALCATVDQAFERLQPQPEALEKTNDNDWKFTYEGVQGQIVVADVLQNDQPRLIFYFMVIVLEEAHKAPVLEELMKANMQLSTKYGLMENAIIQAVEFQHPAAFYNVDNMLMTISMYINHVQKIRQDLQELISSL